MHIINEIILRKKYFINIYGKIICAIKNRHRLLFSTKEQKIKFPNKIVLSPYDNVTEF